MSSPTQTLISPSLKNILYATDFSPCSQAAIPYVCAVAGLYGSTIHVLHVLPPEPTLEVQFDMPPELDADWDVAQSMLKALLTSKPFCNIPCTVTAIRGPLWDVVEAFLKERNIDLVVLGTHGRHGLNKLMLGSVAEQVFRHAPCPVLTVGPQTVASETAKTRIATILFATDFSHGSQHALAYAESLARANQAQLIVLHAVSAIEENVQVNFILEQPIMNLSADYAADAIELAREQLADLISAEKMQELKPEMIVQLGGGAQTILSVAKDKHADLIVMGAHHSSHTTLASHLPWATASDVVRQAHCPVLTIRS